MNGVKVCASILSANFLTLGQELKRAEDAGCDFIHVDIMDGHFVNNLAVGICVAQWLPKGTKLRLDAHLAVTNPQDYIEAFAAAGMQSFIFHPETYPHHSRLIDKIRRHKMFVGIALSPTTSLETVRYLLPEVDLVDQLAVDAGFPNQKYNLYINEKLTQLKQLKAEKNYTYEIHVDGGINSRTAPIASFAGAEVLISGSTLFESADMAAVVSRMKA